jgi:hypothetical protein
MKSQDREPELELLLFQLSDPHFQLLQPPIRDEVGPFERRKWPRVKQLSMKIFKTMFEP